MLRTQKSIEKLYPRITKRGAYFKGIKKLLIGSFLIENNVWQERGSRFIF